MVKNTKEKGSRLEREFKKCLNEWGWEVSKAGGSFGTDLMAVKKDIPPLIISVKWLRKYFRPRDRQEILDVAYKIGGLAILAYKYIPKGKKKGKLCLEVIKQVNSQGGRWVSDVRARLSFEDWLKMRKSYDLLWQKRMDMDLSKMELMKPLAYNPQEK